MPVKRGLRLQFRVRDNAPVVVKNCAAILLSDFCKKTCPYISMINTNNGYVRSLEDLLTEDTNVRISVLENIHDKLGEFAVYQFQYKDNKYKTFALSNIDSFPLSKEKVSESDGIALSNKLDKVAQKYNAIFPDESEQMSALAEWYSHQLGKEITRISGADMAKYILIRVVPVYLATSDTLDCDDLTFIYQDLHGAIFSYLSSVGYAVGKHYVTNQYIPDIPDSEIKVVHQNLFEHPEFNVIGVLHGLQVDDDYCYGGTWTIVDFPNKKVCNSNLVKKDALDLWIHEKIDNYINYMKQEGVENIKPVYLTHK